MGPERKPTKKVTVGRGEKARTRIWPNSLAKGARCKKTYSVKRNGLQRGKKAVDKKKRQRDQQQEKGPIQQASVKRENSIGEKEKKKNDRREPEIPLKEIRKVGNVKRQLEKGQDHEKKEN